MPRTYRVRVMDSAGFLHTHDVEAPTARAARKIAFASTNAETGNAAWTRDVHTVRPDGAFGALCFLHPFAEVTR